MGIRQRRFGLWTALTVTAWCSFVGPAGVTAQERTGVELPSLALPSFDAPTTPPGPAIQTSLPDRGALLREVGLVIGIVGTWVAMTSIDEPLPLMCGPCDDSDVPAIDRWAIADRNDTWHTASNLTLLAGAAAGWADLLFRGDDRFSRLRASGQAAALTVGVTEILKRSAGRQRPFTYEENLSSLPADVVQDATASWPSGHTSTAFSLATSYWLSRHPESKPALLLGAVGGAVLTGLFRVPAGKHFPTDVVSGAAVGVATAVLVHTIRF